MKLTELQNHKIDEALSGSQSVLTQIKKKVLKDETLKNMKTLEIAVTHSKLFKMSVS